MVKIVGEPLKKYVQSQINVRQTAHGSGTDGSSRSTEQLLYLNSKTSWVKLASGISIDENRISTEEIRNTAESSFLNQSLAKHHVLFGGLSSLEKSTELNSILSPRGTSTDPQYNIWGNYWGTYNVNASTRPNSEFGLVPMPGIVSTEVKCLNRGSIRRATVNIKCYSPEQFQIIDLLYMRIGYTMFLEWGNSIYLDEKNEVKKMGYTLIEDNTRGFFSSIYKKTSYRGFLPIIEGYRKLYKGNYDGLLCKVANFSWSFSQDGSYDINLELISLGDIVESLKLNIPPAYNVSQFVTQTYSLYNDSSDVEASVPPSPADNWISSYLFLQKLYIDDSNNSQTGRSSEDRFNSTEAIAGVIDGNILSLGGVFVEPPTGSIAIEDGVLNWKDGFDSETEAENWILSQNISPPPLKYTDRFSGGTDFYDRTDTQNKYWIVEIGSSGNWEVQYITFPQLDPLKVTSQKKDIVHFAYNRGETNKDQELIDSEFYMRFGHLLQFLSEYVIPVIDNSDFYGQEVPMVRIDNNQWLTRMYTLPYQVSLDPRVCIVNASVEPISAKEFFPNLVNWKYVSSDQSEAYGWTMNIYINHSQILASLNENKNEKGNVDLFGFLNSICVALNRAMGGINNLEPVYDEDTHTIYIIDGSYAPVNPTEYSLKLYGYNPTDKQSNFVRNMSLKTEITNDFATMATIGSTAGGYVKGTENTMFSKWNKGLHDMWKEKFVPTKKSKDQGSTAEEPAKIYTEKFYQATYSAWGYTLKDVADDLYTPDKASISDDIIERNISIVTEFFKYCQSKIQEKYDKYSSPSNGFIPINLGITTDGISGIKIYNEINVDTKFLPKNYPDNLRFIIKGVNHKLSDSDWETTIETISISRSEKDTSSMFSYKEIKQIIDDEIALHYNSNVGGIAGGVSGISSSGPVGGIVGGILAAATAEGAWTVWNKGKYISSAYELAAHHSDPITEIDPKNTRSKGWTKTKSGKYVYDVCLFRKEGGILQNKPFVPSPVNGIVTRTSPDGNGNAFLTIKGDDNYEYDLLHMDNYQVREGDRVTKGQLIARQSNVSPPSYANHLHIQMPTKQSLINYIYNLVNNKF